jgi:hypothetical protein
MSRRRTLARWLSTSDAAFSMGERITGWIVSGGIGTILSTAGGSVIGWLAGNLLYGLVIGMGVGMLVLMGAAVKAVRVVSAGPPLQAEAESPQITDTTIEASASEAGASDDPPPQELSLRVLAEPYLKNLAFRIADLVHEDIVIRNRTFEDCTLYGPAILCSVGTVLMTRCGFRAENPDDVFWELSEKQATGQANLVGVIGVEDCVFRDCNFVAIGLAGPPETIAQWKGELEGMEEQEVTQEESQ